jgi:ADP-ribose pyrophosphatase
MNDTNPPDRPKPLAPNTVNGPHTVDPPVSGEPRDHGPWKILSTRVAYHDPWVTVRRDEVIRPDGSLGSYATVGIKPGVCVIALDDQGRVHLTEEFHYAVGRVTVEGVSGGIEAGDTALETAHRELEEELGITAAEMTPIGIADPFTASVHSPTALFVARGLTHGAPRPEGTELIRPVVLPLESAVREVLCGSITHAPTVIALLRIWIER